MAQSQDNSGGHHLSRFSGFAGTTSEDIQAVPREAREWAKLACRRFDAFNPDHGGAPTVFELTDPSGTRRFHMAVRDTIPERSTTKNSKTLEIYEERDIGGRRMRVLAGFVRDLNFTSFDPEIECPTGLVSGKNGWIGVYNYSGHGGIDESVARVQSAASFGEAFSEYKSGMRYLADLWRSDERVWQDDPSKRFDHLIYTGNLVLADHLEHNMKRQYGTQYPKCLEDVVHEGGDYTTDGRILRKLFEGVRLILPKDGKWTLYGISHPPTMVQMLGLNHPHSHRHGPVPFDETGYGFVVGEAGLEWVRGELEEKVKPAPGSLIAMQVRLSPVVRKATDEIPHGWLEPERFQKLPDTR
ncbi:MAG: hypothetical protein ABIH11_02740 [Candidatus Altiarchaeota archaeon]